MIYVCEHDGAGGAQGRLYKVDPAAGKVTILYNSIPPDGNWWKSKPPIWDGPADYIDLHFVSTLHVIQCPRTGAILNGGWDNSGIRRYLDGFVTSVVNSVYNFHGRQGWGKDMPNFLHHNCEPAVAPNGDLYQADSINVPLRYIRIHRDDWPSQVPEYAYGEKYLPRAKLEEMMLAYGRHYIAAERS